MKKKISMISRNNSIYLINSSKGFIWNTIAYKNTLQNINFFGSKISNLNRIFGKKWWNETLFQNKNKNFKFNYMERISCENFRFLSLIDFEKLEFLWIITF